MTAVVCCHDQSAAWWVMRVMPAKWHRSGRSLAIVDGKLTFS